MGKTCELNAWRGGYALDQCAIAAASLKCDQICDDSILMPFAEAHFDST